MFLSSSTGASQDLHADEPPMNHHRSIFGQPDDFAIDCCANGRV
jgi:hypothetical protein